jgi:hypothetical protein
MPWACRVKDASPRFPASRHRRKTPYAIWQVRHVPSFAKGNAKCTQRASGKREAGKSLFYRLFGETRPRDARPPLSPRVEALACEKSLMLKAFFHLRDPNETRGSPIR